MAPHSRRATSDDFAAIATLSSNQFHTYHRENELIDPEVSPADLTRAFEQSPDPTWIEADATGVLGFLYGSVFSMDDEGPSVWTGLDGWAAPTPDTLLSLLQEAQSYWRSLGAASHRVWVTPSSAAQWKNEGYEPVSIRAAKLLSASTFEMDSRLRLAGSADEEFVRAIDRIIDEAQGTPSTNGDLVVSMLTDEESRAYVYEVESEPAGLCFVMDAPSIRGVFNDTVSLSQVGIAPRFQRRGHGRRMIEAVLDSESLSGFRYADVRFRHANAGAVAFWHDLGFHDVAILLQRPLSTA